MSQTEVQLIKDAVIVNADVSNSAAIDVSKISGVMPLAGGTFTDDVTFTGNSANVQFDKSDSAFEFLDNAKAKFGTGDDLQIYHDGSNSYIKEDGTGNLYIFSANLRIENADGSKSYIEANDGGATELYHNGSKKIETSSTGITITGDANWNDNGKAEFGNAADLAIYHNGSHSVIQNDTGTLFSLADNVIFKNNANSETLATFTANSSVELYFDNSKKLETHTNGVHMSGSIYVPDSEIIGFGDTSNPDLRIFHNGNHSFIEDSGTGNLFVKTSKFAVENAAGNESLLSATQDGSVELYHNGTKRFETNSSGAFCTGELGCDTLFMGDNEKAKFGNGDDLQIFHDGSDNVIKSNGAVNIKLQPKDTDVGIKVMPDSGVELYFDNSKKLETLTGGVNIIGALTVNGGSVGGGKVIQAISANSNSTSTSSGSFQATGLSKQITMTNSANKVLVIASGTMNNSSAGSGGGITIKRGTANLAHSNDVMASFFGEDNSNNLDNGVTIHALDGPGAGTHTYEVYLRAFSGTQQFAYRNTGVITLLELDFS